MAADREKPAESSVTLALGPRGVTSCCRAWWTLKPSARLEKERVKLAADAREAGQEAVEPWLLAKAAPEIVEKDRAKHAEMTDKLARVEAQLAELGSLCSRTRASILRLRAPRPTC